MGYCFLANYLFILWIIVYTCQKPRTEQCGFFLWEDDAKLRAEWAVLENGGSEKTPSKNSSTLHTTGLTTPRTSERAWPPASGQRAMSDPFATPTKKGGSMAQEASASAGLFSDDDDDPFGWDEDLEKEVGKLAQQDPVPTPRLPPPETPRKVPRTDTLTSPGKRKFEDMQGGGEGSHSSSKVEESGSSFPITPSTSTKSALHQPNFSSLPTPQTDSLKTISSIGEATPTPARFSSQDLLTPRNNTQNSSHSQASSSSSHCALATQTLTLLEAHNVPLNQAAKDDLLSLLDRHDLKTQGVTRGREITRVALQKKEEKVKELLARIEALEAERELGKTAIAGLKMEKRGNG